MLVHKFGGERFAKNTDTQGGVNFHSNHAVRHGQGLYEKTSMIVRGTIHVEGAAPLQIEEYASVALMDIRYCISSILHTGVIVTRPFKNDNITFANVHSDLAMARNGIVQLCHA